MCWRGPASKMKQPTPILERRGRFTIVRDDLLDGGSKTRFLPHLIGDAQEIVFGGPFCGGAPWALSVIGRELGRRVTLFYAARKKLHRRQELALAAGARIVQVRPGYLTVVQKRARDYAAKAGALFLPLGFDQPAAREPFEEAMRLVRAKVGSPDEVWCATGSGMLARCLGAVFPDSHIRAVAVGLASRWQAQDFPPNVTVQPAALRFEQECRADAPFPTCRNYDRKAWELCESSSRGSVLFWNVAE